MSTLTYADHERRGATTGISVHERRIEEAAEGHLWRSGYLALRDISCTCREEVVTLRGCLRTYYLKQIAQHVISEIEGVRRIINQIEVRATWGCHDRRNSPGVSIGQDWADLGAIPSLEQVAVAV